MSNSNTDQNQLFSSLISDIKSYTGNDPLLPWLRGIRKMRNCLSPQLLKQKLPRFLQKCAHTFKEDRGYRNDLRYLRVWIQLMDFVDDPRAVLRTMEMNRIGMKRSLFYQAYALYYEKIKEFDETEKMYRVGVQNLAEPVEELQKSYEQFLSRVEGYKNKRNQRRERRFAKKPLCCVETKANNENKNLETKKMPGELSNSSEDPMKTIQPLDDFKEKLSIEAGPSESSSLCNDDKTVVNLVETAIFGKSETENACHHGLIEPTINMKEAMEAINSMFREPLEAAPIGRKSHKSQPKQHNTSKTGFEVFVDENSDNRFSQPQPSSDKTSNNGFSQPFKIFVDDEENEVQSSTPFVLPAPKDVESSSSTRWKLREDTVVRRFVGSTISGEPEVENVCHHGLVEPTINLKEAMDDINSMFGKPIDFVRTKRSKKQDKAFDTKKGNVGFSILPDDDKVLDMKKGNGGFSILPDDDVEYPQQKPPLRSSSARLNENDLFEPTVFTKEAIDEINKMFGRPLDF